MAWEEGFHSLKDSYLLNTNKRLGSIEGEISSRDAQVCFAQYCCANPSFAANLLMGVDIYPFQDIMLRAMNSRDYFLGVAGRGLGKCLKFNDLQKVITRENGLTSITSLLGNIEFRDREYIKDIPEVELWNGSSYQKTNKILIQKGLPSIEVKTRMGYKLEGSENHKIKTLNKLTQEITWKRYHELDINHDYVCISRNVTPENGSDEKEGDEAYICGLMTGDGCLSTNGNSFSYSYTSMDQQLLDWITPYTTGNVQYREGNKSVQVRMTTAWAKYFFEKYGLKPGLSYDKEIPQEILKNKFLLKAFIQGFADTDGGRELKGCGISMCTTSIILAQQLHLSLLNFGIISRLREKKTTSGFGRAWVLQIYGIEAKKYDERVGFRLNRKIKDYKLESTSKYNTNIDILPGSVDLLQEIRRECGFSSCLPEMKNLKAGKNREDFSLDKIHEYHEILKNKLEKLSVFNDKVNSLTQDNFFFDKIESITHSTADCIDFCDIPEGSCYWSNGFVSHNSTIAAIFIPLYAIFNPGVTIGITSSTFRQARSIFSKIESIAYSANGKYLKQCMVGKPSHRSDAWEMQIGQSKIVAIPLGCFAANSRVASDRGFIKIEDYAKSEPNSWENSPLSVDTLNGRMRSSHALNAGEQKCYRVLTKRGYEVTVGANHEFFAYDGVDFAWKKCSEIGPRTKLLLNKKKYNCPQPEYNLSFDIGYKYGSEQFFSNVQDERIFSCTEEFGKGFLSGLFETGAKVVTTVRQKFTWRLALPSEKIALGIQQYLLAFGILSSRENHVVLVNYKNLRLFGEMIGDGKGYFFQKNEMIMRRSVEKTTYDKRPRPKGRRVPHEYEPDFFIDSVASINYVGKQQTYDLRVPVENNYVVNGFCSHNSGDKIRGYRFNLLVIDELLLLSEKVINEVLLPFMAIQINPRERQKVREAEAELIEAGLMKPEDRTVFPNNKLIGLTSASYEFEYLYSMYKDYSALIYDQEAKNVSHAIMQMSCEMAPVGLYDKSNVENARKSYSRAQFDREYMAKFTGDSSGFYSAKKLYEISLKKGDSPTVKIKGDGAKNYLLAIDPNYDASETSDDFAMTILEIDETNQYGYMVHGYAVASCSLSERMDYVRYIFDNFNIVYMVVDKAGGAKFVKDINDLGVLPFTLDFFDAEFELFDEEEMFNARQSYNNGGKIKKIVHSQYFSAQWIRTANESLSGAIDGQRIWFASPTEAEGVNFEGVPIQKLKFNETETYGSKKEDLELKRIDFIDNQSLVISKTKNQCALIEATTGATGTQRFDLPSNLQKQTGPTKTRKDSYSALVLANWGLICYFALLKTPERKKNSFRPKFLA